MDASKSLGNATVREARLAAIEQPHVAPLTAFVRQLRAEMRPTHAIPYFDPLDGGTHASILFLPEAPGPRAIEAGFVSRNNPDETAKNFYLPNQEVGIDRELTVTRASLTAIEHYPYLEADDIRACLVFARRMVGNERVEPAFVGAPT